MINRAHLGGVWTVGESRDYARLLRMADVPYLLIGKSGRIEDCGSKVEEMLSCRVGDSVFEYDFGDRRWFIDLWSELESGKEKTMKLWVRRRDGRSLGVEAQMTWIDGVPPMLGFLMRPPSESSLPQRVLDALPESIFLKDPDGRHLLINDATLRAIRSSTGLSLDREDILGKTDEEIGHLEEVTLKRASEEDRAVFSGKEIRDRKIGSCLHSGTDAFSTTKLPLKTPEGNIEGVVGSLRRVSMASETLETDAQMRALVEQSPAGMFVLRDGRFVYGNQALADLLETSSGHLARGVSFLEFVHEEDRARLARTLRLRVRGEQQVVRERYRLTTALGKTRIVESIGFAHEHQGVRLVMGSLLDVTDREEMEQQYLKAQKMDSIGKFAGGICHDFNNVLSVILGTAMLLRMEDNLSSELDEGLARIYKAGDRAAQLTKQLLTFSRKEAPLMKNQDLNQTIQEWLKLYLNSVPENIAVDVRLSPDPVPVSADRNMLEQVLMNLLFNARDAMPQGGELTLETRKIRLGDALMTRTGEIHPGDYVQVRVADTGVGMNEETQAKLFEPFYTTKKEGRGTGLGMSIVQKILRHHRSYVDVESAVGVGTVFRLFIPLSDSSDSIEESDGMVMVEHGFGQTVMLLEDEEDLRYLVEGVLNRLGFDVLTPETTAEARKLMASHDRVDVLLTDLILPESTKGHELARELQSLSPHLKVVLMSGYSDGADTHLQEGWRFLAKPFSPEELAATLEDILASEELVS